MQCVVVQDKFGLENLKLVERPDPEPGPGQLLLKMKAVSLNYRDLLMARGHYNPRQPLPLIPASDGVGEVVAVGSGVTRAAVGDRVCPIFAQGWLAGKATPENLRTTLGGPLDGTLTELMTVSAEGVVQVPKYLSDAEAATLPCAAVTAWSALITHGGLKAGETVLTQGSGGVSIFAIQIAKLFGARVIATSSSDTKRKRLEELGADATLNYKDEPKWGKVVRDLSGGAGVDHVVEVGGGNTLGESLRCVRPDGQISVIGVLSGVATDLNILPILMQNIRLQGVLVGHRESFEAMNRAFALSELRPVVDRVFPMAETRAALEHMATGSHFGKIVIAIDS